MRRTCTVTSRREKNFFYTQYTVKLYAIHDPQRRKVNRNRIFFCLCPSIPMAKRGKRCFFSITHHICVVFFFVCAYKRVFSENLIYFRQKVLFRKTIFEHNTRISYNIITQHESRRVFS